MPKGQRLSTILRKVQRIEKARVIGRIKGEKQAEKHKTLFMKFIETLKTLDIEIDPIEAVAVGATTYVIHSLILTTTELLDRVNNMSKGLRIISGTPEILGQLPFADSPIGWIGNLPFLIAQIFSGENEESQQRIIDGIKKITEEPNSDNFFIWAVSLVIAYYVQKHGITDILGAARSFLGLGAATTA